MGHFLCGVETVKSFVKVHFHCNVSNLKKISKMSTLALTWKNFCNAHGYFHSFNNLCRMGSGVARPIAAMGRPQKCRLSTRQICLWEFKMREDHVTCLDKDISINKASWRPKSNTHKLKWVMFFHSSLLFYFLLSLHMNIQTVHVSSNFLPFWFVVLGKPTAWLFNSLLIPGNQMKKLRDVWRHTYFPDVNIYVW